MRVNNFFIKITLTFLTLFFVQISAQKKFTVVLDAGHGGSDHGAKKYYTNLGQVNEKDITLAVTMLIGRKLEKNKDFKVIYTRKSDVFPSLTERTNLANRSKADLFVSMHCNSATNTSAYGTETFVQGPNQNKENLEVAKAENDVIFLDEQDRETFASYDPTSPESLIALKIQQGKYLESSLLLGSLIEDNFVHKDKRFSRGVKQQNLHVLRRNAMPSVLVEIGFISNAQDAAYIASSRGQDEVAESVYQAILEYKRRIDRNNNTPKIVEKSVEVEKPSKYDYRILLTSSATKYNESDPALKGLKDILIIKEGNMYRYYYGKTNMESIRKQNINIAKEAGFRGAVSKNFTPNEKLAKGYYTIEIEVSSYRLSKNHPILAKLNNVEREKIRDKHYYTYGKVQTLEEAIKLKEEVEAKGIKNVVIQKK